MIKAVLFDLDGTLLNRDASVVSFIHNQYERMNQYLRHIPKELYVERFIALDERGYVWKDKVYKALIKEFEIHGLTMEILLKDYVANFQFHCVPSGDLEPMLENLKNLHLKLGIISNGIGQFQMDNIEALGIKNHFDVILISESENLRKPDPLIFERAMERLNVQAAESIFVGDHPLTDVEAAKNVGMLGVWKKDSAWEEPKADYCINNLSEVNRIVQSLNA